MKYRRTFAVLLLAMAVILLLPRAAKAEADGGSCGDNLTWTLDEEGRLAIEGSGPMYNYPLSNASGSWQPTAPWGTAVTSVVIGEGATRVGNYAFYGCASLTSAELPSTLTAIGEYAFFHCGNMTDAEIPPSVTAIGSFAFQQCASLTEIRLPEGLRVLEYDVLDGCSGLTEIEIPSTVKTIRMGACMNCTGLTRIDIPEGVTSIEAEAFTGCTGATVLTLPSTLPTIPTSFSVFRRCGAITDVTMPVEAMEWLDQYGMPAKAQITRLTLLPGVTWLDQQMYGTFDNLQSLTLPEGLTGIAEHTFESCASLESVQLPQSLLSIGGYAFRGCEALRGIDLPGGLTSIGAHSFEGCAALTAAHIPGGVTQVSECAFVDCSALTDLTIAEGVEEIGMYAFRRCSGLTQVRLPDSLRVVSGFAFGGCSGLQGLYLPGNLTTFDKDAVDQNFEGKSAVPLYASIQGATPKAVGRAFFDFQDPDYPDFQWTYEWAYENGADVEVGLVLTTCLTDEKTLAIPEGTCVIGGSAFMQKTHLETVSLPQSLKEIRHNAFGGCTALRQIDIPGGVVSMGSSVFSGCQSLERAALPQGLTAIPDHLFDGCGLLRGVAVPQGVTAIGDGAFMGCNSLTELRLPDGVTRIGSMAFYGCSHLTGMTLPSQLADIGQRAFQGCGLVSAEIPEGVTSIPGWAFADSPISRVLILRSVTEIDDSAFSGPVTVFCYEYSAADTWAAKHGCETVYLDDPEAMEARREITLPSSAVMMTGESLRVTYTVFPTFDQPQIYWGTGDAAVAAVQDGEITALSPGETTVTLTVGTASASMTLRVYDPVADFELPEEIYLVAKTPVDMVIGNVQPEGAYPYFDWESSDTAVAEVDGSGHVETYKPGEVTITATAKSGVKKSCALHICYPVTGITLSDASVSLRVDQTPYQLTATVTTRDGSVYENRLVAFESDDPAVAQVDENGTVTLTGAGSATVTASWGDISAECLFTVRALYTLVMPAGLHEIGEQAFEGSMAEKVVLSGETESILSGAFRQCGALVEVYVPDSVTYIAGDAFDGCPQARFVCESDNYGAGYAREQGIPFEVR